MEGNPLTIFCLDMILILQSLYAQILGAKAKINLESMLLDILYYYFECLANHSISSHWHISN